LAAPKPAEARQVSSTCTVASLTADNTSVDWPEAVAIVQGVCPFLLQRPTKYQHAVPTAEGVEILASGSIQVTPGPHVALPVRSLAEMLQALQARQPHPALRLLIGQSIAEPDTDTSVEEFSKALARYERADRQGLIRLAYLRWKDGRLLKAPPPHLDRAPVRRALRGTIAIAGIGLALAIVVGGLGWLLVGPLASTGATLNESAAAAPTADDPPSAVAPPAEAPTLRLCGRRSHAPPRRRDVRRL
jgi:hypothetical protein